MLLYDRPKSLMNKEANKPQVNVIKLNFKHTINKVDFPKSVSIYFSMKSCVHKYISKCETIALRR